MTYRPKPPSHSRSETLSVYRSVRDEERLRRIVPPIQGYIAKTLHEKGIGGVEPLAKSGLRLVLLQPVSARKLTKQPEGGLAQVRQSIETEFEDAPEDINNLVAISSEVTRGSRRSAVGFRFASPRLLYERDKLHSVAGYTPSRLRMPVVALCTIPEIEQPVATYLTMALSSIAGQVTMSFGRIDCDHRP